MNKKLSSYEHKEYSGNVKLAFLLVLELPPFFFDSAAVQFTFAGDVKHTCLM